MPHSRVAASTPRFTPDRVLELLLMLIIAGGIGLLLLSLHNPHTAFMNGLISLVGLLLLLAHRAGHSWVPHTMVVGIILVLFVSTPTPNRPVGGSLLVPGILAVPVFAPAAQVARTAAVFPHNLAGAETAVRFER